MVAPITGQKVDPSLRYAWMIPLMVVMVVGATIYLAVRDSQIEYVYSLASACFGYYFGFISPRPAALATEKPQLMNGVEQLTK